MRRALLFMTVAAALLLAPTAPLQADSISASNGSGPSTPIGYSSSGSGWEVGVGGYQDVYYDPDAGPWIKNLAAIPGALNNQVFTLVENLHVGGGPSGTAPAWTDFHEEIQTPGWNWSPTGPNGEQSWSYTLPGGYTASYVIPMGNTSVDWTFPTPLPVCTNITLIKYVVFHNPPGNPAVGLTVAEYPTVPEPATLSLLALGALTLFRRRRS